MARTPLIPGHTPGEGFGLSHMLVFVLGLAVVYLLARK